MAIAVQCGHCKGRFSAPDEAKGRTAACPKCGEQITVQSPDFAKPTPIIQITPEASTSETYSVSLYRLLGTALRDIPWKAVLITLCILTFLVTLRTDSSWGTILHYLTLIFVLWVIAAKIASRFKQRVQWYVLASVVAALVWAWGYFDYNIHHWTNTTESSTEWHYTDYIYRGHSTPYYRRAVAFGTKEDGFVQYHIEGAFSETGKQHGRWHGWTMYTAERAKLVGENFKSEDDWYWYGEEVTEGEWHLRNR